MTPSVKSSRKEELDQMENSITETERIKEESKESARNYIYKEIIFIYINARNYIYKNSLDGHHKGHVIE